jgi:hypothetical protein
MFSIDFSEVPDREAAPAGEYILECVTCELKVSQGAKTAGTKMLGFHWKIVESEHTAHVFENLMLGGDAMWKTKQCFVALFGKGQTNFSMSCEELVGVRVRGRLTQEVWAIEAGGDGEVRNRVGRYLPLTIEDPEAESLDDMFGA